jgi:hypothetical protein
MMTNQGPQPSSEPYGHAALPVRASPYSWTTTPPTLAPDQVHAWHWARFRAPWDHHEDSHVVEVLRDESGNVCIWYLGAFFDVTKPPLRDAQWSVQAIPEPTGG